MVFVSMVSSDCYVLGDVPGRVMEVMEKHNAPSCFGSLEDAIRCLRECGNKSVVDFVPLNGSGVLRYGFDGELIFDVVEDDSVVKSKVDVYFELQERFNRLNRELVSVKEEKDSLLDDLRVDVDSVFVGVDFFDDYKVELTDSGLRVSLFVKRFNDYRLVHPVPLALFGYLEDCMGVPGVLNIVGERKRSGNSVYELELIYEVYD